MAEGLQIVLAIHTPRDERTAVFANTRERADYLEAQGHRCTILTPDDFPATRRSGARFVPIVYPFVLARWLAQRGDVDAVLFHSYSGWPVLVAQRCFGWYRKLRSGVIFHGLEPLYYAKLKDEAETSGRPLSARYRFIHGGLLLFVTRIACRQADVVFCLNSEEKQFLVSKNWVSPERVRVIGHPVLLSFFIPREYRERASRLLCVGQWLAMKGTRTLVQAFTTLARANRDLRLCCAGTLVASDDVRSAFPDDVRGQVEVYPRIDRAELLALHKAADVFVFTSVYDGFSIALAEAAASGLPIITTPVGFAPDLLSDGESAVLARSGDADGFCRAVSKLLNDRPRREQLGRNAQKAVDKLKPDTTMRDFEVCWELLAPKKKSSENGSIRSGPNGKES